MLRRENVCTFPWRLADALYVAKVSLPICHVMCLSCWSFENTTRRNLLRSTLRICALASLLQRVKPTGYARI
jgi:hypothetical protein